MMRLSTMKKIVDTLDENWKSPIANAIAQNWSHDPDSVDYCRSSANFIFSFMNDSKKYFLRFNSSTERTVEGIESEIAILNHLNKQTDCFVKPVLSRKGQYLEQCEIGDETYLAVVFEGFEGEMCDIEELNGEVFFLWGEALGNAHACFDKIPEFLLANRQTMSDHLAFIEEQLPEVEIEARGELNRLKADLKDVRDKKGLIHFDFELDNVIWQDKTLKIIDLDDAAVYGYTADIAYALRDLFDGTIDVENPLFKEFMKGYQQRFQPEENLKAYLQIYLRLHNLLTFTKLLRTLDYQIDDQTPKWLKGLTEKLNDVNDDYRQSFVKESAR